MCFCFEQSTSVGVVVKSCGNVSAFMPSRSRQHTHRVKQSAPDRPQLFVQDRARYCLLWNSTQLVSVETQQESCTDTRMKTYSTCLSAFIHTNQPELDAPTHVDTCCHVQHEPTTPQLVIGQKFVMQSSQRNNEFFGRVYTLSADNKAHLSQRWGYISICRSQASY